MLYIHIHILSVKSILIFRVIDFHVTFHYPRLVLGCSNPPNSFLVAVRALPRSLAGCTGEQAAMAPAPARAWSGGGWGLATTAGARLALVAPLVARRAVMRRSGTCRMERVSVAKYPPCRGFAPREGDVLRLPEGCAWLLRLAEPCWRQLWACWAPGQPSRAGRMPLR